MRAAVVGGGLAGAALAWRLTLLGARVTVFTGQGERHGPGGRSEQSHQSDQSEQNEQNDQSDQNDEVGHGGRHDGYDRDGGHDPDDGYDRRDWPGRGGQGDRGGRRGAESRRIGPARDATGASGGLVRAFEPDPAAAALAAESLAELRGDPVLASWAGYQPIGSAYVLAPDADPAAVQEAVAVAEDLVPGSARLVGAGGGTRLRGLAAGTLAVSERHAGYIAPARLRAALLAAAFAAGARHCPEPVTGLLPGPAVTLAGGPRRFDTVALATGPWTPRLLAGWGLAGQGLRTRQIQYTLGRARLPGVGAFVDDTSGLYGRPVSAGLFLLGLPSDRWQVAPEEAGADRGLAERVAQQAARRLGLAGWPGPGARTVTSLDCYAGHGGLRLRRLLPGAAVYTFTGGSGGAAKTALAAARHAAAALYGGGTAVPEAG